MKLKFRVFCVFVVVLLSAIGCSDDDPRDPDLVIPFKQRIRTV